MSSGLNDGELRILEPWHCICGFETNSGTIALRHINEMHDGKSVNELTSR